MDCLSYPRECYQRFEDFIIKDKQPIIQSTGLVVKLGQVVFHTHSLAFKSLNETNISIDPTHMPVTDQALNNDAIIEQHNPELADRLNENNFAVDVHENQDDTVFDNDDQEKKSNKIFKWMMLTDPLKIKKQYMNLMNTL